MTASSTSPSPPSTYYGRPILKPPVWTEMIPAYFFTGGLAGASGALVLAARMRKNRTLARSALLAAMGGTLASTALLIADLHDPKRFHHMLRVFKITSPMSVGTYILSTFGSAASIAFAGEFLGVLPPLGRVAEVLAAVTGPPLATYTATLIADTAVPAWHDAHAELPFVFTSSAAASAGAWAVAMTPPSDATIARRLAVAAAVVETIAVQAMEKRLGELIGEPYHTGKGGLFGRLASALTLGGAATIALFAKRNRGAAIVGGMLVLGGSACERFSVFFAGMDSARDPKYVVIPQRERADARARSAGA